MLSLPVSTLGSFPVAFQNVFPARNLCPLLDCASAYITQGARVPQRFGGSQMFQMSVKFFWAAFAAACPDPPGMWPIAPGQTRCTSLSPRIRTIPPRTPRCFVRNRVHRRRPRQGGGAGRRQDMGRRRTEAGQDGGTLDGRGAAPDVGRIWAGAGRGQDMGRHRTGATLAAGSRRRRQGSPSLVRGSEPSRQGFANKARTSAEPTAKKVRGPGLIWGLESRGHRVKEEKHQFRRTDASQWWLRPASIR